MNLIITIPILLVAIPAIAAQSQQLGCFEPFNQQQPAKQGRSDLYGGQQGFSLALLNAINKVMPNENLFFSPYSTYHALLIAYFMAGGETEAYLKKVLRLDNTVSKI